MGEIISARILPNRKVLFRLRANNSESKNLSGHIKNILAVSTDLCSHPGKIIQKGNHFGTKYIEIPLSLRSRKKTRLSKISYQKIETEDKIYYIVIETKEQ